LSLLDGIKDLLFPAHCQGCDRQLDQNCLPLLCSSCLARLSPIISPLCPCCGTPFPAGKDHLCGACLQNNFAFNRARSIFLYQEPIRSLLVQFKFSGKLSRLDTLAILAEQTATTSLFEEPDLILPVPLHIKRLRSRGFNQSLLIARSCFPEWRRKIKTDLLIRHQATTPQTSLSGRARRNNLQGAFRVCRPGDIADKNLLLVDDVFTTGATLHECAKMLHRAGAEKIEAFTMARAL
jgi:ComF family protein